MSHMVIGNRHAIDVTTVAAIAIIGAIRSRSANRPATANTREPSPPISQTPPVTLTTRFVTCIPEMLTRMTPLQMTIISATHSAIEMQLSLL